MRSESQPNQVASKRTSAGLPLFHLYGDPPNDQAFDFVHIERISSRSSINDWLIQAHRHRNLFQILIVENGSGEMSVETAIRSFAAPCAIFVSPNVAHGFKFHADVTDGFVITFSEDVAMRIGDGARDAISHLAAIAEHLIVPIDVSHRGSRILQFCIDIQQENFLARDGYRLATRALLSLIAIEIGRRQQIRARTEALSLGCADRTVETLKRLIEDNFRQNREIGFYADRLAMTTDRVNDHVKRVAGVTAGHLIRQRVLTEAKRELVFTNSAINEIAYELGFGDPSHFARFFRKQTGMTPQDFRAAQLATPSRNLNVTACPPDDTYRARVS